MLAFLSLVASVFCFLFGIVRSGGSDWSAGSGAHPHVEEAQSGSSLLMSLAMMFALAFVVLLVARRSLRKAPDV